MIKLKLNVWKAKGELVKLKNACQIFWAWVETLLQWPLQQLDAETCTESVLAILAWQWRIVRLPDEPTHLFRLRVKYAYANALDAGSTAGFQRIFERLNIGFISIEERIEGQDWDIVRVNLSDESLAGNQVLLKELIRLYGRLCRRYTLEVTTPLRIEMRCIEFGNTWHHDSASM